jgi:hypothetical protein
MELVSSGDEVIDARVTRMTPAETNHRQGML